MKNIKFVGVSFLYFLYSCSTNPENTKEYKLTDTVQGKVFKSVFDKGTFKSYPEIVKTVFSEGSSKEEVQNILGKPDLIQKEEPQEHWYYGKSEIIFYNGIVRAVENNDSLKGYVRGRNLQMSPDSIEMKLGFFLLDRMLKHIPEDYLPK